MDVGKECRRKNILLKISAWNYRDVGDRFDCFCHQRRLSFNIGIVHDDPKLYRFCHQHFDIVPSLTHQHKVGINNTVVPKRFKRRIK